MTVLIDGRQIATRLETRVQEQVRTCHQRVVIPGLAVIQVEPLPDDNTIYVQRKAEWAP
jgi:5,10-methylene-tetrahydrofolate dehydrogenase/methenyl tetrahydrofolate cyclohydrolase